MDYEKISKNIEIGRKRKEEEKKEKNKKKQEKYTFVDSNLNSQTILSPSLSPFFFPP